MNIRVGFSVSAVAGIADKVILKINAVLKF